MKSSQVLGIVAAGSLLFGACSDGSTTDSAAQSETSSAGDRNRGRVHQPMSWLQRQPVMQQPAMMQLPKVMQPPPPRCCSSAPHSSVVATSTPPPWLASQRCSGSGLPLEALAIVKPPRSRRQQSSSVTPSTSSESHGLVTMTRFKGSSTSTV